MGWESATIYWLDGIWVVKRYRLWPRPNSYCPGILLKQAGHPLRPPLVFKGVGFGNTTYPRQPRAWYLAQRRKEKAVDNNRNWIGAFLGGSLESSKLLSNAAHLKSPQAPRDVVDPGGAEANLHLKPHIEFVIFKIQVTRNSSGYKKGFEMTCPWTLEEGERQG